MDNVPLWTGFAATFVILLFLWRLRSHENKRTRSGYKKIPGPRGLPVIGNLLQLRQDPSKQFCDWSEEYGDIYKVKLGPRTLIVVSEPKLAKELLSDPSTTGRESLPFFVFYEDIPDLGMFQSEGERWEVHRRFLLRQLRDFGFGKSSMEALIMDEVNEVVEKFKKKAGTPIPDMRPPLRIAIVNSFWSILTSKRFDQDDPTLHELARNLAETFNEAFAEGSILLPYPWLQHIFPTWSGYKEIRRVLAGNQAVMEKMVADKMKTFRDENLHDFVDTFLAEVKKADNDPKSYFNRNNYAERQLVMTLFDLFFAGSDTTALTTSWGILLICKNPETQRKLQEEIFKITGDTRRVSVADRSNMPYTLALIDEINRCSSIIPDGVQHRATADVEFKGYLIEKDWLIQPNILHIHNDPKIWGDPENFRPERFLSPDGKRFIKSENVHSFQPGRRVCVGETLARDSIFLYLTTLFQQFDIALDPNKEEPSLDAHPGFFRNHMEYSVVMMNRLKK